MKPLSRFFLFFLAPLALGGCSGNATSLASGVTAASSGTYYAMDTVIVVAVGQNTAGLTSDSVYSLFQTYDALADNTQHRANVVNVYDLNQTNDPLAVNQELFDLLKFSYDMKTTTSGYFNPLICGLSDLWKKDLFNIDNSGQNLTSSGVSFVPSVPSDEQIQA